MKSSDELDRFLATLQQKALALGASDAAVIFSRQIPVEDDVILFCKDPLCESYGLSIHCPPYVKSAESMRNDLKKYSKALIFKLDVPVEQLLEEDRFRYFKEIYSIAVALEKIAIDAGYTESYGYAAGSCKPVFCPSYQCQALRDGKTCRYPSQARPSMEAVGVNVFKLFDMIGWEIHILTKNSNRARLDRGVLGGMLLVG